MQSLILLKFNKVTIFHSILIKIWINIQIPIHSN